MDEKNYLIEINYFYDIIAPEYGQKFFQRFNHLII